VLLAVSISPVSTKKMHPSKCLDFRGRNGEPVSDNGDGTFNEKTADVAYLNLHHQPQLVTPDLTAIDIIITTV